MIHGVTKSRTQLSTWTELNWTCKLLKKRWNQSKTPIEVNSYYSQSYYHIPGFTEEFIKILTFKDFLAVPYQHPQFRHSWAVMLSDSAWPSPNPLSAFRCCCTLEVKAPRGNASGCRQEAGEGLSILRRVSGQRPALQTSQEQLFGFQDMRHPKRRQECRVMVEVQVQV